MAPPSPTKTWRTDTYPAIDPSRPELSLAGKSVVITGGGSGIGGAIARSCAKAGAPRIAIIGRRAQVLEENRAQIAAISPGAEVLLVQADIASAAEVDAAFASIKAAFGPLDILVSNAAYFSSVPSVLEGPLDDWSAAIDVNIKGVVLLIRAFMAAAKPSAAIVNISAGVVHVPLGHFTGYAAYAATKSAGTRIFDYLQAERPDVHVVSLHPGRVLSEMGRKVGRTAAIDQIELPGDFTVWALSDEAQFLKGKFVWVNWDAEELKQKETEIASSGLLTLALEGWPFASPA